MSPKIERIWVGNAGRNFNYLVACPDTGQALVIDPYDGPQCLAVAAANGWRITQIANTHEHGDHIAGNAAVRAATGARLLAHPDAVRRVGSIDRALGGGDMVQVGTSVALSVLVTPGHTMAHICLFAAGGEGEPVLFCGDTLFNAGVGNCHGGGDPNCLYETFRDVIAALPDATRVYPGHEYLARNLGFALSLEPHNRRAQELLEQIENTAPAHMPVLTLGAERAINPFLRLGVAEIVAGVRRGIADFPAVPTARELFLGLRALRDRW